MIADIASLAELFPTRNLQTARQAVRHSVALGMTDCWRIYLNRAARNRAFLDAATEAGSMRSAELERRIGLKPAQRVRKFRPEASA